MNDQLSESLRPKQSQYQFAMDVFLRAVALISLFQGIAYWVAFIGVFPDSPQRFDLLPVYWQVTGGLLAALLPFAAVGLWMLASWGKVIWALCAILEIAMYGVFADSFRYRPSLIIAAIVVVLVYVALHVLQILEERRSPN